LNQELSLTETIFRKVAFDPNKQRKKTLGKSFYILKFMENFSKYPVLKTTKGVVSCVKIG